MTYVDRVAAPLVDLVSDPPDDEGELVHRARQRDTQAFEQLYRAHVPRVYAICLRMTADQPRAEEYTQKAFLTAWDKLAHFRGESAFGTWLHRIAVNAVLSEMRADQRRTRRVFGTDDPDAMEKATEGPPAGLNLDLEQAIATLPPQARAIFVLHDVEGWQHHEIASQLGLATGTTKAHLHRARKLLQKALQ